MTTILSNRTRSLLARSLPLVQQRREALLERMAIALAELDGSETAPGGAGATAAMLTDLLLDEAKRAVETGAFGPLDRLPGEQHRLAITGRHYSRFGDALIPVLRDLLGPIPPREVLAAWCDTFWAIIHSADEARAGTLAPVAQESSRRTPGPTNRSERARIGRPHPAPDGSVHGFRLAPG